MQNGAEDDIINEERYNPYRDPKTGRFTSRKGSAYDTKYAPSPRRNRKGITVGAKTYGKICGEFNTIYQNTKKGDTGFVSKGKFRYLVSSDGEGGVIIHKKWKQW